MPKLFLDTNVFIDIISGRHEFDIESLQDNRPTISVLTIHVAHYISRSKCPDEHIIILASRLNLVPIPISMANQSMYEPTIDFEDNIQLLSALENNSDLFITNDKALLKLEYFQSVKIIHPKDLADYLQ